MNDSDHYGPHADEFPIAGRRAQIAKDFMEGLQGAHPFIEPRRDLNLTRPVRRGIKHDEYV